jgi:hypothetical protein
MKGKDSREDEMNVECTDEQQGVKNKEDAVCTRKG